MSGQSDQLHMQDVPDRVLLSPTLITPEEQQQDVRYVEANQAKETYDDSTGDYSYITLWKLTCFLINSVQIMHNICRRDQACCQSQNSA